jgi:SAM-dependent methyltransferase
MTNVKTDMHAYYAERAPSYEEIYNKPERQDELDELHELVQEALFGQKVLELACGTGYWTAQYAEMAESVLATDINPALLDIARAKPFGENVRFELMDAFAPQVDSPVTACFAGFWWSHVMRQDQIPFLEKLRAAVGKDTWLMMLDNSYVEGSSTSIARTDLQGNTFQIRKLPNGDSYEILKNFPTDSALRKKLSVMAREIRIVRMEHFWMLTCRLK